MEIEQILQALGALHEKTESLETRLTTLEKVLRTRETPSSFAPAPATKRVEPAAVMAPPIPQPLKSPPNDLAPKVAVSPVVSAPSAPPLESPTPARGLGDWERIIGGQWALWLGSLSLFLAMASFLAFTWSALPPAPPWARVLMGLAAGAGMMGAGARWRPRVARWWSDGLLGAGLAVCYLSVWASGPYFGILSFEATFVALGALTALGVALALVWDARGLALFSTLGGFLVPIVLSGGRGGDIAFLSYLAVLNGGLVAVSLWKRWRELTNWALGATILEFAVWYFGTSSSDLLALAFATLYFLLFCAAACFYSLGRDEETDPRDLLLLFSTSSIYGLSAHFLAAPLLGAFPGLFALGMASFFGTLAVLASRNRTLRESLVGLCLLALTLAFPAQFGGNALAIGWTGEAVVLAVLARRLGSKLFANAGKWVWLASLLPLAIVAFDSSNTNAFWNSNAFTLLFAVGAAFFLGFQARDERDNWAPFYATMAVFGGAFWLGRETLSLMGNSPSAPFVLASVEMIWALSALIFGVAARVKSVRSGALGLAAGAAIGCLGAAIFADSASLPAFWNARFAAFGVVSLGLLATNFLLKRHNESESQNADLWLMLGALGPLVGASFELFFVFKTQATALYAIGALGSVYATFLLHPRLKNPVLRSLSFWLQGVAVAGLCWNAATHFSALEPFGNPRCGALMLATGGVWVLWRALNSSGEKWAFDENTSAELWRLVGVILPLGALSIELFWAVRPISDALWILCALWSVCAAWLLHPRWEIPVLRTLALVLGALAGAVLLGNAWQAPLSGAPFCNARFGAFAVTIGAWFWASWALGKRDFNTLERAWAVPIFFGALGLILWISTQETLLGAQFWAFTLGSRPDRFAQMMISLVWSALGASLLIIGVWRAFQPLRLAALGLLCVTAIKVFLFDLSFLDGPSRMFSLGGLGVALLLISGLYGRFGSGKTAAKS